MLAYSILSPYAVVVVSVASVEASKLDGSCFELSHADNFLVPFKGWHLVNKSASSGKESVKPFGDIQVVNHLAGCASEAMFAVAITRGTQVERWYGLADQAHHYPVWFPFSNLEIIFGRDWQPDVSFFGIGSVD